jgi:hypothetical protein
MVSANRKMPIAPQTISTGRLATTLPMLLGSGLQVGL